MKQCVIDTFLLGCSGKCEGAVNLEQCYSHILALKLKISFLFKKLHV